MRAPALLLLADRAGVAVDWFVIIKKPGRLTGYLYADATAPTLVNSTRDLNSTVSGAVAATIVPALTANYLLYNDDEPNNGVAGQRSCVCTVQ